MHSNPYFGRVRGGNFTIAVRDLEAAKRVYSDLGFSITNGGRHPTGTENSIADFGDAGGYLELVTPYDASLPGGNRVAEDLKKGEDPLGADLEIASAEQSAHDLTAAGLKISGPIPATIARAGEKEPPPTRWWSILFA